MQSTAVPDEDRPADLHDDAGLAGAREGPAQQLLYNLLFHRRYFNSIPPTSHKNMTESNPLKTRFSVRGLAATPPRDLQKMKQRLPSQARRIRIW